MVMKERLPALRRWATSFDHILGHARLSDVDAELEQLSVDPRRSPENADLAWVQYPFSVSNKVFPFCFSGRSSRCLQISTTRRRTLEASVRSVIASLPLLRF